MKNKANWDSFVLTSCNIDPTDSDGDQAYDYKGLVIDFDCTSIKFNNQLVAPLPTPPIENAIKSTIAYDMYESLTQSAYTLFSVFKDEAKPQYTGTPFTIPLKAVMCVIHMRNITNLQIDKLKIRDIITDRTEFDNLSGRCAKLVGKIASQPERSRVNFDANFNYKQREALLTNLIEYMVKEIYTYWKIREVNIPYKSDFIQRMKERILITNPIKESKKESQKDYVKRIADLFQQEFDDQNTKIYAPIDNPLNHAMKLETNGVMTLKNINLLKNDFLAKITILEQEVNVIQQTLGTVTQDIGENSANGDFAFSAESGTVWMYDAAWYNSGDIVPDQVTPASDATPLADSGTGVAGTSNEYSRGVHKHQLQVSDVLPSKDTSVGTVGQASSYARSDHQHPIQTVDTIPVTDSADGSYGTVDSYARNDHSHPINVQTNASIVPVVNGVGNSGSSAEKAKSPLAEFSNYYISAFNKQYPLKCVYLLIAVPNVYYITLTSYSISSFIEKFRGLSIGAYINEFQSSIVNQYSLPDNQLLELVDFLEYCIKYWKPDYINERITYICCQLKVFASVIWKLCNFVAQLTL
ncbi:MAG: hypothetical protein EZS28_027814 [Streblomastix strix]|uniref:Uncharacterized protein n=1 Tax=Streblomastix strix TaxID=222440 RepID=A0A5J4V1Q4_9EUKA|nr:MAG: hypothetical protein EZS28_027814 [Streblomastix strix]